MALPDHLIKMLGIIEGFKDLNVQLQPAGFDLSVKEVYRFRSEGYIGFVNRKLPNYEIVEDINGVWELKQGVYRIIYNEVVKIPEDVIAFCLPRSSLLRSGAIIYCAFWDPGYVGRGEGILNVLNPCGIKLEKDARVSQLVFIKLIQKPKRTYKGVYQYEKIK